MAKKLTEKGLTSSSSAKGLLSYRPAMEERQMRFEAEDQSQNLEANCLKRSETTSRKWKEKACRRRNRIEGEKLFSGTKVKETEEINGISRERKLVNGCCL